MTWIRRLYDTYEYVYGREPDGDGPRLMPIGHSSHRVHLEVTLDIDGQFRYANVVSRDDAVTLIPCTEESGSRSGTRPVPHPLSDKLQYVAGDFTQFGGKVTSGYAKDPVEPHGQYLELLARWADSPAGHEKVRAVLAYLKSGTMVRDLVDAGWLHVDDDGRLLESWSGDRASAPAVFASLGNVSQHDAVVRWRVDAPGDVQSETWSDPTVIQSWIDYYQSQQTTLGFCMVTGRDDPLAIQHPARIRNGGDKAKLISANDSSGFTYRGRFVESNEAASLSFEVTQKAHNALRWLVERQAHRDGSQAFVIWSPGGPVLPASMLGGRDDDEFEDDPDDEPANTASAYAQRLKRKMAGYHAELGEHADVIVLGLDSATPGRLAVTFYREIASSELLERIERWHTEYAWRQHYEGRDEFIGVPAPRAIIQAAYGDRAGDHLRRATFERLMPCIIDGVPVPRDLVRATVQRACNPVVFDRDRRGRRPGWEGAIGVACSLHRGTHPERNYQMELDPTVTRRDYLYGRLLAVADSIESYALWLADETRETNAERLFQRFASRPASTWRTIYLALRPYMARLSASERGRGFRYGRERLIGEIKAQFESLEDYNDDSPLEGGEFLVAFYLQRRALFGLDQPAEEEANVVSAS